MMGAWGAKNFSNDTALDWVARLVDVADGLGLIEETLRYPVEERGYLDEDYGSEALAAAEVVAAMAGSPPQYLPEDVERWLQTTSASQAKVEELREMAVKAAERIKTDSELKELWDGDEEWLEVVDDLLTRLNARS